MSIIVGAKHQAARLLTRTTRMVGQLPRRAYAHLFIESEGVHSRLHLHHFYSLFLPDVTDPVSVHVELHDAEGRKLGTQDRTLQPFGSELLAVGELLATMGASAPWGSAIVDVEPSPAHTARLLELGPELASVQSPFWMGFWDEGGSVAYVHSIDQHFGQVFGVNRLAGHVHQTPWARGGHWTSNRIIEAAGLERLDAYLMNQTPAAGATAISWLSHPDGDPVVRRTVELNPRGVARISVTRADLEGRQVPTLRLEVDDLFTGNGKPYVLARYGSGPFSLHHG